MLRQLLAGSRLSDPRTLAISAELFHLVRRGPAGVEACEPEQPGDIRPQESLDQLSEQLRLSKKHWAAEDDPSGNEPARDPE